MLEYKICYFITKLNSTKVSQVFSVDQAICRSLSVEPNSAFGIWSPRKATSTSHWVWAWLSSTQACFLSFYLCDGYEPGVQIRVSNCRYFFHTFSLSKLAFWFFSNYFKLSSSLFFWTQKDLLLVSFPGGFFFNPKSVIFSFFSWCFLLLNNLQSSFPVVNF